MKSQDSILRRGFTLIEILNSLEPRWHHFNSCILSLVSLGKIWTHDWSERHYVHHKESLDLYDSSI